MSQKPLIRCFWPQIWSKTWYFSTFFQLFVQLFFSTLCSTFFKIHWRYVYQPSVWMSKAITILIAIKWFQIRKEFPASVVECRFQIRIKFSSKPGAWSVNPIQSLDNSDKWNAMVLQACTRKHVKTHILYWTMHVNFKMEMHCQDHFQFRFQLRIWFQCISSVLQAWN